MRHRVLPALILALLGSPANAATKLLPNTVASAGDASIGHSPGSNTWALQAGGSTLTLVMGPSDDFHIVNLVTASNRSWIVGTASDSTVTVNGATLAFGNHQAGFTYRGAFTTVHDQVVQLDIAYDLTSPGLRVVRHYAISSGSPTFETWNTFYPLGGSVNLSNLNGIQFTIPNGTIRYLNGLQGDTADVQSDSAFTLRTRQLDVGANFTIGAQGRSSEQSVPWFAIDGAQDEFYAAFMWSGAWSLAINRTAIGLALSLGLTSMTTTISGSIDGPHALFGVAQGSLAEATGALRSYVLQGVRSGRPLSPLVTYNTWFAYGTDTTDETMRAEMDHAAALGTELFVLDAGWYPGAGANGSGDFDAGLGSWQADPARFPNGLGALSDYAHGLGMKFGLWIEPEHVDRSIVADTRVQESWLATAAGSYGSDVTGQVCFASQAARQWVIDQLSGLIDTVHPDYLKWDNNGWINCNRPGHGHGATDGNFAHVSGLYQVLAAVRARYPDLMIENVAGGGNRLDLGMVRYSDVAWMDDRTAPSVHVRHNLEGLSAVFPPAYLLSFVTDHDSEPLHDASDMPLYFRSRMAGALGLCFRSGDLSDADAASMAREIGIYKTMRSTLSIAAGSLLTRQASPTNGPAWDVLQEASLDSVQMLICAYQTDDGVASINVKPTGLQADTTYEVWSVDAGLLGTAQGSDLMANGIDVLESPSSAAHILLVLAKQ
jgi:alpha-galactosidase